jgi:transcriptional regulator
MGDAPSDYIDTLLKSIVGVQIDITRLIGKSKLGQNKAVQDIRGAGEALMAQGRTEIGAAMLAEAARKEG